MSVIYSFTKQAMKIGEKEIVINQVYTRGIDKEFNKILFK
jgi:hypothetical protein